VISGAAAEVALEAESDLVLGGIGDLVEQRHRGHDHAGGAVPALEAVVLLECLLHRVHRVPIGEALDGGDRQAIGLDREHRARLHRLTVDVDRAGAARRGVAADVGAREAEVLAHEMHQERTWFDVAGSFDAVDRHRDLHVPPLHVPEWSRHVPDMYPSGANRPTMRRRAFRRLAE
jgi:hypothetical protein